MLQKAKLNANLRVLLNDWPQQKSFPPIKREYPEPPPPYTRSQKYGFLCEVESEFLSQQNVGEDTM